jgi:hypothetical protein
MRVFALAVVVIAALPARAEQVVALAPLDGLGVDPGLLGALQGAVERRARALGLQVVSLPASCAGEVACLAQAGRAAAAGRVFTGTVGVVDDQVHLALRVIDVASAQESAAETATAAHDQAEVAVGISALRLLDLQRYNESGAIHVQCAAAGAVVWVDGAERGTTPLLGPIDKLPPGRRQVEVRLPGVQSYIGFVEAPVDAVATLSLRVREGQLVEEALASTVDPVGPRPTSPLLWAGMGTGVLALAAGVGAGVSYGLALSASDRMVQDPVGQVNQENVGAVRVGVPAAVAMSLLAVAAAGVTAGLVFVGLGE